MQHQNQDRSDLSRPDTLSMHVLGARDAKPAYFDISLILNSFAREGITFIENNLRTAGMEPRESELVPLGKSVPAADEQIIAPALTIYDIAAHRVADHPQLVKGIAQLMKNCAVPYEERVEKQSQRILRSGLWFVPEPAEIKRSLQYDGAQILVVLDANHRLWGAYLYDTNVHSLAADDKTLCLKLAPKLKVNLDEIGFAGVVAVDPDIEKQVSEGGAGIQRKETYIAMHTLMVGEAAANGVRYMISYVWDGHFTNAAMKTHAALGWLTVVGKFCNKLKDTLMHTYTDPGFGQVVKMQAVPVVLDTQSPLQIAIAATPPLKNCPRIDLDRG